MHGAQLFAAGLGSTIRARWTQGSVLKSHQSGDGESTEKDDLMAAFPWLRFQLSKLRYYRSIVVQAAPSAIIAATEAVCQTACEAFGKNSDRYVCWYHHLGQLYT